jgi:hypothetical protein
MLTDELSIPTAIDHDLHLVLGKEALQKDTIILQRRIYGP